MRRVSKIFFTMSASLVLALMLSVIANGQHLISTKAGFVNNATGKVYIVRQDAETGEKGRVALGTQMRDGDRIQTDIDSQTELLLSPGSYLRLAEKSEVRAVSTSFAQMAFELVKGSMIVETSVGTEISEVRTINKKTPLEIITPQGSVAIAKDGLYRFDTANNVTQVSVRQGELILGTRDQASNDKATKVGRSKSFRLTGSEVAKNEIAKINKEAVDDFDLWSFNRAQTLASANVVALRNSRTMSPMSYGWLYNSYYNCYTFMPGRRLFYSPYGFGFFGSYGDALAYFPYGYGYGYGGYGGYYPNNNNNNTGGGVANAPARVITGVDREPVRRELEGRRIVTESRINSADNGRFGDVGSRTVSSSPSVISAPAATSTVQSSAPSRPAASESAPSRPSRP